MPSCRTCKHADDHSVYMAALSGFYKGKVRCAWIEDEVVEVSVADDHGLNVRAWVPNDHCCRAYIGKTEEE